MQHAGSDFPPVSDEDASFIAPPFEERPSEPTPAAQPEPPRVEAQPPAAQEPPRRRSTIREPAPFASEGAPPPAPTLPPAQPVISSSAPEETGTPKRGWWAKRFSGDKG
jgi:hypothetical protein